MNWRQIPFLVHILGVFGAAMAVPMLYAAWTEDWASARSFLYPCLLVIVLSLTLALAFMNRNPRVNPGRQMAWLLVAFIVIPVVLAIPLLLLVPTVTPLIAYFEMSSAMTTTGFTVFDRPATIAPTLHLWRALVGWLGGYLIVFSALAFMAPLNIGGFEIRTAVYGEGEAPGRSRGESGELIARMRRIFLALTPAYGLITLILFILLLSSGQETFFAFCNALAVISTSGIAASAGPVGAQGGFLVELLIAAFLVISASSIFFDPSRTSRWVDIRRDPELKVLLVLVIVLPTALVLRHWIGALEVQTAQDANAALRAFWGSAFTVISFVTTAGYESAYWDDSQSWSGLGTTGLILMGLAAIGGGVASTAGGIKLLRIYALYKHGVREMERLVMPRSIAGAGIVARRIRRQGAFIAWIFLMLFLFSIAFFVLALTFVGLPFDAALQLSVAAISNTGPGYALMSDSPLRLADLDPVAHMVLCAAMILGRMETLAVVALVNPGFWRR